MRKDTKDFRIVFTYFVFVFCFFSVLGSLGFFVLTNGRTNLFSYEGQDVLGASDTTLNMASIIGQAGTIHIYNKICNDVSFSEYFDGLSVARKTYEVCSVGLGTGFVINGRGDIVSNAHVVSPNRFDALMDGFSVDGKFEADIIKDMVDIVDVIYGKNAALMSQEELGTFLVKFLYAGYKENEITIIPKNQELYVQGNEAFDLNSKTGNLENTSSHYKASVIKSNNIESFTNASFSEDSSITEIADLAIIRLNSKNNMPSIVLSEREALTGDTIYVIGYPGVVEDGKFVDISVALGSTVTKGTVSSIKPNTKSTFNLIQIDASLDRGNSGGPIVNENGEVVGVATYLMLGSGSGNYNSGVSIEGLKNFLTIASVENEKNEARVLLDEALNDLSKKYYSRAKEKLSSLITGSENLRLSLGPYVELCNAKIVAGEDETPWIDLGIDIPNWGLLLIGGGVLLVLGLGVLLIILLKKRKNRLGAIVESAKTAATPTIEYTQLTQTPVSDIAQAQEAISPISQSVTPEVVPENPPATNQV